tara:strand:+ start:14881 stop:16875 length:1995 start_codon:yes stop_codon:yes gene_type:complete
MPYTSGKLKGQLTAAEIRKLIRGHNKLVSIKIPPKTDRDGLIKLIEDNGYKLDHKKQSILDAKKSRPRRPKVTLDQAKELTKPKEKTALQKQKTKEKKEEKEIQKKKEVRQIKKEAVKKEKEVQKIKKKDIKEKKLSNIKDRKKKMPSISTQTETPKKKQVLKLPSQKPKKVTIDKSKKPPMNTKKIEPKKKEEKKDLKANKFKERNKKELNKIFDDYEWFDKKVIKSAKEFGMVNDDGSLNTEFFDKDTIFFFERKYGKKEYVMGQEAGFKKGTDKPYFKVVVSNSPYAKKDNLGRAKDITKLFRLKKKQDIDKNKKDIEEKTKLFDKKNRIAEKQLHDYLQDNEIVDPKQKRALDKTLKDRTKYLITNFKKYPQRKNDKGKIINKEGFMVGGIQYNTSRSENKGDWKSLIVGDGSVIETKKKEDIKVGKPPSKLYEKEYDKFFKMFNEAKERRNRKPFLELRDRIYRFTEPILVEKKNGGQVQDGERMKALKEPFMKKIRSLLTDVDKEIKKYVEMGKKTVGGQQTQPKKEIKMTQKPSMNTKKIEPKKKETSNFNQRDKLNKDFIERENIFDPKLRELYNEKGEKDPTFRKLFKKKLNAIAEYRSKSGGQSKTTELKKMRTAWLKAWIEGDEKFKKFLSKQTKYPLTNNADNFIDFLKTMK